MGSVSTEVKQHLGGRAASTHWFWPNDFVMPADSQLLYVNCSYFWVIVFFKIFIYFFGYVGPEVKASACNAGDLGSIPGSERPPGEGNGNPLQYSCLENPMDREAWWATVHRVAKSRTRLSDFTFTWLCWS